MEEKKGKQNIIIKLFFWLLLICILILSILFFIFLFFEGDNSSFNGNAIFLLILSLIFVVIWIINGNWYLFLFSLIIPAFLFLHLINYDPIYNVKKFIGYHDDSYYPKCKRYICNWNKLTSWQSPRCVFDDYKIIDNNKCNTYAYDYDGKIIWCINRVNFDLNIKTWYNAFLVKENKLTRDNEFTCDDIQKKIYNRSFNNP